MSHNDDPVPPLEVRTSRPFEEAHPDIDQVSSAVLYEGPRSRKEIVQYVIKSRNNGEIKGYSIGFRTYRKQNGILQKEPTKSFTLDGDAQIQNAIAFVNAAFQGGIPSQDGKFFIVPVPRDGNPAELQKVLGALTQKGRTNLLLELLDHASKTPHLIEHLMQQATENPDLFVEAAATLNLARYRRALEKLNGLIATSNREQDFQNLLSENPWMFGSEYSEKLDRRILVRDMQQDFVLRRTADGYVEIVEIKTPLTERPLFRLDPSRDSYFAGPELSAAVGQAQKYVEEYDAHRHAIQVRDGEDTNKVRAKIIIGRDGDDKQSQALRRFNGHLHRIEVLTFDQLARIATRVVSYLEELVPSQARNG